MATRETVYVCLPSHKPDALICWWMYTFSVEPFGITIMDLQVFALAEAEILVGARIVVVQGDEYFGGANCIIARVGQGRDRLTIRLLLRRCGHRIAGQHRLAVDRTRPDRILRVGLGRAAETVAHPSASLSCSNGARFSLTTNQGTEETQPMRDDQRRPIEDGCIKRPLHDRFARRVEGTGRLVQYKNRRLFEQGPRDRNALSLAAAQLYAPLADHRVVAVGKLADEFVRLGQHCRLQYLLAGRTRSAVFDVFVDGCTEQDRLLFDEPDQFAPQPARREMRQLVAIDRDATPGGLVESLQQRRDGRFSTSTRTDQCHRLAWPKDKTEIVQHPLVGSRRVHELNALEANLATQVSLGDDEPMLQIDFGLQVKILEHARASRHASNDRAEQDGSLRKRSLDALGCHKERHQVTGTD
uniref:Uncharacterized protein n=1 Tax=Anopheles atroparvus TaxID=41427 RepID=A0A182IP12_ANOAO